MGLHGPHRAVSGVDILCLGGAQVIAVKAAVLQRFAVGDTDPGSGRLMEVNPQPASEILPHVQHRFPCRCGQQRRRCPLGLYHHGKRRAVHGNTGHGTIGGDHRYPWGGGRTDIHNFAVIDAAGQNGRGAAAPALIGAQNHCFAGRQLHPQLTQQRKGICIRPVFRREGPKPALGPAVAQQRCKPVFSGLQQRRDVVGLNLNAGVIGGTAGREIFLADPLAVEGQLIKPRAGGVDSGAADTGWQREVLFQNGMDRLVCPGRRNPLGLPGRTHPARLEPVDRRNCCVAAVSPNLDGPVVSGKGRQSQGQAGPQTVQIGFAAVIDEGFHPAVCRHADLCGNLAGGAVALRDPGDGDGIQCKAQRHRDVVGLTACDLHRTFLLLPKWAG